MRLERIKDGEWEVVLQTMDGEPAARGALLQRQNVRPRPYYEASHFANRCTATELRMIANFMDWLTEEEARDR